MNAAATLTLVSAALSLFAGILARRLAAAPSAREQRWFAVVVLAASAYALCNLPTTLPGSARAVTLLSGLATGVLPVLVFGWLRLSQEIAGVVPGRAERRLGAALLAVAPLLALPGVAFSGQVVDRPYPLLGVVYRQAITAPAGDAAVLLLVTVCVGILARLVAAWRRGTRHAGLLAAAFAVMLACAVVEGLAVVFLLPLPLLLEEGFAAPILAASWVTASRFVESARSLEALRGELADQVSARTVELSRALDRLHQAEQLAALGRFANGLAHQVNNPAAVVASSLAFLGERVGPRLAPDEADALADARTANDRIAFLVRRLVDAARVTEALPGLAVADLGAALRRVVSLQATPAEGAVVVRAGAAEGIRVPMRPDGLELVLEALLRGALDAAPAHAQRPVEIDVERGGGRVRLVVADHGPGLDAEALARALDPFFATAAQARAGGVGLAVARGLARASGGDLRLESAPGAGTRAVLELPELAAAGRADAAAS